MRTKVPVRLIVFLAVALLALSLTSVVSARPGGAGGSTTTRATLSASPNPVAAWSVYQLSGCGYAADRQINLVINEPGSTGFYPVAPDANGCFSIAAQSNGAGGYKIDAYQNLSGKNKQSLMATTSLSVS